MNPAEATKNSFFPPVTIFFTFLSSMQVTSQGCGLLNNFYTHQVLEGDCVPSAASPSTMAAVTAVAAVAATAAPQAAAQLLDTAPLK